VPVIVPSAAAVQEPVVTVVFVAVGAVHPAGTVIVVCDPAENEPAGPVKLNVSILLMLPAVVVVGETTIAPWPLVAGVAVKFAVIVVVTVPKVVSYTQGFVVTPVPQDPPKPAVETVQLVNAKPEAGVAVIVTLVRLAMAVDVHVVGQLIPPVLLVIVPPPVGDITAVITVVALAAGAAKAAMRAKSAKVSSRFMALGFHL
jgi:hypothetical protein